MFPVPSKAIVRVVKARKKEKHLSGSTSQVTDWMQMAKHRSCGFLTGVFFEQKAHRVVLLGFFSLKMRRRLLTLWFCLTLLLYTTNAQNISSLGYYTPYTSSSSSIAPLLGDDKDCPPCFNCMLPGFECLHFANCSEYNGKCNCPPGFGGDDCKQPCMFRFSRN